MYHVLRYKHISKVKQNYKLCLQEIGSLVDLQDYAFAGDKPTYMHT